MKTMMYMNIFELKINRSIELIKIGNYTDAEHYIHLSMSEDDISPKPHNLLGIIAELKGDLIKAEKHYRAAYALDPTFKAACENLQRITSLNYKLNYKNIMYGNELK